MSSEDVSRLVGSGADTSIAELNNFPTPFEKTLYNDDLFKLYYAKYHNDGDNNYYINTNFLIQINSNDDILVEYDLVTTKGLEQYTPISEILIVNPGTGTRYIEIVSYLMYYFNYLVYIGLGEKVAKRFTLDMMREKYNVDDYILQYASFNVWDDEPLEEINYDNYESHNIDIVNEEFISNSKAFKEFDDFENILEEIIIAESAEPKSYDLTFQYTPKQGDNSYYNFHNFLLDDIVPLVMEKSQAYKGPNDKVEIRVYEFPVNIRELEKSASETLDKAQEGLVLKLYNQITRTYDTAIYYSNINQLVILNAQAGIYEETGIIKVGIDYEIVEVSDQDAESENEDSSKSVSNNANNNEIKIPQGQKTNVTIQWTTYGIELELDMFMTHISTSNNKWFYVSETFSPYFAKSKSEVIFRVDEMSYKLEIHRQRLSSGRELKSAEDPDTIIPIETGTYYVTFTLHNVSDEIHSRRFLRIISAYLYQFTKKTQNNLINTYKKYLSKDFMPKYVSSYRRGEDEGEKIFALQSAAPEIFVEGYARICSKQQQGIIIPDDDLDAWLEENPDKRYLKFPLTAEEKQWIIQNPHKRKIPHLGIQPEGNVINFACSNDLYPYPGLRLNPGLSNKEQYPLLPRCYKHDEFSKVNSHLYNYIYDKKQEERVEKILQITTKKQIKAINKLLNIGRTGSLPESVINMFRNYGFNETITRTGAYKESINSFIHCVMHAINDEYYGSAGYSEREILTMEWRQSLVENLDININLVKQELYDETDEQIIEMFTNESVLFDSKLFYRLLENEYKINIFIIHQEFDQEAVLEIPNHKIVHVRGHNIHLPSIVLFKHYKMAGSLPHYEILRFGARQILSDPNNTSSINLFSMFDDIYSNYLFIKSTLGPSQSQDGGNTNTPNQLFKIYKNIYSSYSVEDNLLNIGLVIKGQYIDRYGKCRGYLVDIGSKGEISEGSILCMPQQPGSYPKIEEIISFPIEILDYFELEPSRIHTIKTKTAHSLASLAGVWFPINDYDMGLYIPIANATQPQRINTKKQINILNAQEAHDKYIEKYSKLPRTGNPLLPIESFGTFSQYMTFETNLSDIITIITHLYRKYALEIFDAQNKKENELNRIYRNIIKTHASDKYNTQNYKSSIYEDVLKSNLVTKYDIIGENDHIHKDVEDSNIGIEMFETGIQRKIDIFLNRFTRDSLTNFIHLLQFRNKEIIINKWNESAIKELNFEQTLKMMERITRNSLVDKKKIFLPSAKLVSNLKYYVITSLVNQPVSFYKSVSLKKEKIRIFSNVLSFQLWVDSKINPNRIVTVLSDVDNHRTDPYIYKNVNGEFFVIQNVLDGDIKRALNVGYIWNTDHINSGYRAGPINIPIPYVVYSIVGTSLELIFSSDTPLTPSSKEIVPAVSKKIKGKGKEKETNNQAIQRSSSSLPSIHSPITLIKYNDGSYGVMLPLN